MFFFLVRRDPTNFRPRINKMNSVKDQEQKASGNYFFNEEDSAEEVAKEEAAVKSAYKTEKGAKGGGGKGGGKSAKAKK